MKVDVASLSPIPTSSARSDQWIAADRKSVVPLLVSLCLLGWFVVGLQGQISGTDSDTQSRTTFEAIDQGYWLNVVLVVALAVVGSWYLLRGLNTAVLNSSWPLLVLFGSYLAWSVASLLWSADVTLTIRRSGQLVLLVVGSFGIGVGFYARQPRGLQLLITHVVIAGACSQALLWLPLISTGDINFLDPRWYVKNVSGSPVGFPTAYSVVGAIYLLGRPEFQKWRRGLLVYILVCFTTLFAQKMRMVIISTLLIAGVHVFPSVVSRRRTVLLWSVPVLLVVCLVSFVLLLSGDAFTSAQNALWSYATLDATQNDTESLSGRLPLWDVLLGTAISQQPWIGQGFGAYWTVDNTAWIWQAVRWPAVTAHNGYVDEILGTGIVGLTLFLGAWAAGMFRAWQLGRQGAGRASLVVIEWMVLFLCFNTAGSIMQFYFQFPFYVSLAGLAALVGFTASASRR